MRRKNSARPAATSNGAGRRLLASAAVSPARRLAGEHGHCRGNRAHLGKIAVAMQDHVAARRDRGARCAPPASPTRRPWRCRRSSKGPRKPIESRITSRTIVAEMVAGATGSMALNTTCAVMPSGRPASGRKAAKSVASSVARSVVDHRQPLVAVRRGAAMAGDVLEHRQHAAVRQTLRQWRRRWPRPCPVRCRRRDRRSPHRHPEPARRRAAGNRRRCPGRRDRRRSGGRRAAPPQGRLHDPGRRARHKRRPADSSANAAGRRRCTRPPS